ncbi:MAG: DinB family protein [Prevotellaceae bacterium]|nr:DinB family protein [Prevotellaceae bacterium]
MFPIREYQEKIEQFYALMLANKNIVDIKLADDKWTLKEMLGHLVDSASNNHQWFIRLQLEKQASFPAYDQEAWKNATKITAYNFEDLVNLWKSYNQFLLHIIQQIDENNLSNVWVEKQITLKEKVEDYFVRHMNWHLDLYKTRIEEINAAVLFSNSCS